MKESSRKRLRALPLARSSPSSPERCCASTTSPSPSSSPIVYMSTAAARDPTVAAMAVLMAKALTWARERESQSFARSSVTQKSIVILVVSFPESCVGTYSCWHRPPAKCGVDGQRLAPVRASGHTASAVSKGDLRREWAGRLAYLGFALPFVAAAGGASTSRRPPFPFPLLRRKKETTLLVPSSVKSDPL